MKKRASGMVLKTFELQRPNYICKFCRTGANDFEQIMKHKCAGSVRAKRTASALKAKAKKSKRR